MGFSYQRLIAVWWARNIEFLRDRASLSWNIAMPILLVCGLALVFGNEDQTLYKVGVIQSTDLESAPVERAEQIKSAESAVLSARYVDYVPFADAQRDAAIKKVARHSLDLLIDLTVQPPQYWVNNDSPKGYAVEKILQQVAEQPLQRQVISGEALRYVDWLIPGVLGMNIMFSCLFGVGYVIVRYRKSGFLKRLNATPLTAFEFLSAQVLSRLALVVLATVLVYLITDLLLDFRMLGSYFSLLVLLVVGCSCMIAMGLLVAARVTSEELAGGLLNLFSWPMMVLSGVWFSLEGAPAWVQTIAEFLPLTHLIDGARSIMLDGSGLAEIWPQILILIVMTGVFMGAGAALFKWRQ